MLTVGGTQVPPSIYYLTEHK